MYSSHHDNHYEDTLLIMLKQTETQLQINLGFLYFGKWILMFTLVYFTHLKLIFKKPLTGVLKLDKGI